jgi:YegS/Rv2252/BmrU family lipid kinase
MSSEPNDLKQAVKDLRGLQFEQAESVRKIGRMRDRLEKRSRKIQKKEVKIARLEQQVHQFLNPESQLTTKSSKALRPARLIVNATSGTFEKLIGSPEALATMLRAHGIQAKIYIKESTKQVQKLVKDAIDNNEELVIAAGGDGTVEDVAFPLVGSDTTLGIIPAGTMNNLARVLGIPLDIEQACALLGAGITRQIDIGLIRNKEKPKRAYFMETAGLGLSIALPAGQNIRKGRWGKIPEAIRKLFDQDETHIQIELDSGEKIETKVKLVTVSNAPLFAMNNLVAPDAKMDDGLLDVAVYDGMGDGELAKYFLNNAKANRVSDPNVRFYRTRHVHIRSHQEMADTADKEELPDQDEMYMEVIPRAINMIVGQGFGLNWPVEAVQSVPPLTGKQTPSKKEQAEEQAKSDNGRGNSVAESPLQQPESPFADKN